MPRFVPLRTYIYDRLYHRTEGYFCKKNFQLGQLKAPINFKKLIGYDDYQKELVQKYPENAWLTPCQIFKPYYGMTVGKYIKRAHEEYVKKGMAANRDKIRIVEAGAGTGTAAESILYYFKNFHPDLYQNIEYNIVEISPTLCTKITSKLQKSYPKLLKSNQLNIINDDIKNYKQNNLCFMMFFEVLDNLPHDKVIWNQQKGIYDRYATVNMEGGEEKTENIENDLLIKAWGGARKGEGVLDKMAQFIVSRMLSGKNKSKDIFLPTFMYKLMTDMKKNTPKAHLIISDFDHLRTSIQGTNAPIVSKKGLKSFDKNDYNSYLVPRGEADIFFPVNFNFLQVMNQELLGKSSRQVKSYEFIGEFCEQEWAQTRSSFNPIKQDFGNTSFLVTQI